MFTCIICNRSLKTRYSMERHLNTQFHNKTLTKCSDEQKKHFEEYISNMREKLSKTSNKNNVNKIKNFKCECCNKSFRLEKNFLQHNESKKHKINLNPTIKQVQKSNENIDRRIPVINRKTQVVKYGKNAPMKSKLSHFLVNNPDYDIHMGYSIEKTLLLNLKDKLLGIVKFIEEQIIK